MSSTRPEHDWDDAYGDQAPPWDIGRPQPAFVRLAEAGSLSGDLLDAGCGTGEHAMLAAGHGAHAVGIDISPRAIALARSKARERGVNAAFEVHDAMKLSSLGQSFDTVLDSGLFHTFDDADRAGYVAGLHTVLHSGGHLHLMCFSDRQPGDWGPRRVTEDELRAALGEGWRIESITEDRFEINPEMTGTSTAEAWLVDAERL
jgi:SAM-dependent methyltransferase